MFDEEDEESQGVLRGYMNAFILLVLVFLIIGTIMGVKE